MLAALWGALYRTVGAAPHFVLGELRSWLYRCHLDDSGARGCFGVVVWVPSSAVSCALTTLASSFLFRLAYFSIFSFPHFLLLNLPRQPLYVGRVPISKPRSSIGTRSVLLLVFAALHTFAAIVLLLPVERQQRSSHCIHYPSHYPQPTPRHIQPMTMSDNTMISDDTPNTFRFRSRPSPTIPPQYH